MKALITGATGFVGRHLAQHLREADDEVVTTGRASGGPDVTNALAIEQYVQTVAPEVIYHLAGQSDVHRSWMNPIETYRANVEGMANVLAAAKSAGVHRIIAVLSADVYGRVDPADLPITEDAPFLPVSPYAASKAAAEFVCVQAFIGSALDVVRVRPFTHIGPGQTPRFVAAGLAARIAQAELNERDEILVGRLDTRRDFTDVRDVVRAYRLLAECGKPGEAYNICTGTAVEIQAIADTLLSMSARPLRLVPDPALQRPADVPVLVGDATKLIETTGWKPAHSLADTLRDMLDDWRARARATPAAGPPSHFD